MKQFCFLLSILIGCDLTASVNAFSIRGTDLQNANEFLVAILNKGSNQNWNFRCTGALIHPNFVLTAGHCLNGGREIGVQFFKGPNGRYEASDLRLGRDVRVHVDWRHQTFELSEDVGIIHIPDAPQGHRPIPFWGDDWSAENTEFVTALTFDREPFSSTAKSDGEIHYLEIDMTGLWGENRNWVGFARQNEKAQYMTAACGGDSGAPVVVVDAGRPYLVGVITAGIASEDQPIGKNSRGELVYMKDYKCGPLPSFYQPDLTALEAWMASFPGSRNPQVLRRQPQ